MCALLQRLAWINHPVAVMVGSGAGFVGSGVLLWVGWRALMPRTLKLTLDSGTLPKDEATQLFLKQANAKIDKTLLELTKQEARLYRIGFTPLAASFLQTFGGALVRAVCRLG